MRGPLAGILAGDLAAAQKIPGGLFADVAELVKLLHGQLIGEFAPVDVVHSNTPQKMICRCSNLPVYCLLDVVLSVLSAALSKNVILAAYEPKPESPVIPRKKGGKP